MIRILEAARAEVARLERRASLCLASTPVDRAGHRGALVRKATLLAGLGHELAPFLENLPAGIRRLAGACLGGFAYEAEKALRLASVFYLSALLYPPDHQPGEPNDLDVLIDELREDVP